MSDWKGAWFLATFELKKERWSFLFTLFFIAYILLFTTPAISQDMSDKQELISGWMVDFLYFSLLPILGFMMNRTMMGYWKTDAHSRKLAAWRALPISPRQIVMGRMLQVSVISIVALLILFSSQYIWLSLSGIELNPLDFILYVLFWICYSLAFSMHYAYWELGHSGKTYFYFCILIVIVMLGAVTAFTLMAKTHFAFSTLHFAEDNKHWIPALAIVITVATLYIGVKRTTVRMQARNYMN